MDIGRLNRRVTIQSDTHAQDSSYGSTSRTWADSVTVWAKISPITGGEAYEAKQVTADITHEVIIRYRTGVVPQYRLKYGSRYFYILAVLNIDEQNKFLKLMCKEVVLET